MNSKPAQSRSRRIIKWIFSVILFQVVLINISAAFHAHRITHYYDDEKVRQLRSSSGTVLLRTWRLMTGRKYPKSLIGSYPSVPYDTIRLATSRGTSIECWYLRSDSSKGSVILFHGLSSNKSNHLSEAYAFLEMGYNTLLVDFRAHGNSGGSSVSLGVKESEEVRLAYDHLKSMGEKNIVLWGMSLGAVVIAKAIDEYGLQPSGIILEMPFDRLQDHVRARARVFGFPDEPFGFVVTLWTGLEQGYWGFGHKTSKYIRSVQCPALLQWGAKDNYVTSRETRRIYENMPANKSIVVYENAGHQHLLGHDEAKWRKAVGGFLESLASVK